MMLSLTVLTAIALILCLAITPACRSLCKSLGWVDHPSARKVHLVPIPRGGGIAVVLSYITALLVATLFPGVFGVDRLEQTLQRLLPAILVVFATGLLDDIFGLKPWAKILGSFAAAALACSAGLYIPTVGGVAVPSWLQIGLTCAWLIGCTNALNLIDGLDGLATGVGLFATLAGLLTGILTGNVILAILAAPLVGALLGFLPYNFSPASIFLGDCGSFSIGFLLGCFAIIWWASTTTFLGMAAPLIALAIPVVDTTLAIIRRVGRGKPVFDADREHIHHRLLASGYTPKTAAYVLYAAAGILASVAILLSDSGTFVRISFINPSNAPAIYRPGLR